MKPSERRALEAEKRAREAAEYREKELRRQAAAAERQAKREAQREARKRMDQAGVPTEQFDPQKYDFEAGKKIVETDGERLDERAGYRKLPKGEIEVKGDGYHKEGFFSKNARIIGLVIGLVLVLTVGCPLGLDIYFTIREMQEAGTPVEGDGMLTVDDIFVIAQSDTPFTWDSLGKKDYRSFSGDEVREYPIEGTQMVLRIEKKKDNKYPSIVRIIHYTEGAYFSEVRGADVDKLETFFEKYSAASGDEVGFDATESVSSVK